MSADAGGRIAMLREEARGCRNCSLWQRGTQTVFGAGPVPARLMLVGEQPGDREDVEGRPFLGPAGKLLAGALAEAGLAGEDVYVTNAVKHFKWRGRGKRRIHDKPTNVEVHACLPWLLAELELVRPRVLVLLGATAAQALLGRDFRVSRSHGVPIESKHASIVLATTHPSAVLRAGPRREELYADLLADLRVAAGHLRARG
jgi:uracil-DNA glycosylase